ncbi:hypothetical protein Tco_1371802 [Tanacetum coccineum]
MYLEYVCDLEEKLSSHDRIVSKMGQSIQTIHMLGKKPNNIYEPFLKAGLGYKNLERLKKAIATQLKMYVGKRPNSAKLTIDSPNSEETLEGAEEIYKTDVILMSASLSKNLKELKEELIEEVQELLNIFESMEQKVNDKSSKENVLQNEIDRLMENQDLLITISELKNKLKTVDNGKNVNTKSDKSKTFGTLLHVTSLPKNIAVKAKKVSNTKSQIGKSLPSETKIRIRVRSTSNTLVSTQKWVAKLSTLPSALVSRDAVHVGNDHFTALTGYGYYVQGNLMICHVYYVEGICHNLFSVRQICDGDLEVAFRSNTCYVRNLEGEDLLTVQEDVADFDGNAFYNAPPTPVFEEVESSSTY